MKTQILKYALACAMISMITGCIVLSVYPFYTAKDLIFDPGLAGRWVKDGSTNEFWRFTAAGEKSWLLTTADERSTNCFEAHLFRLKQHQFLDLLTTNRDEFGLPAHLITEVARTDSNLSLRFLDYGWLAGLLKTNPATLRHIVVPEKPGDTNSGQMVYLTADTKELQKFLLKHAADTNAFNPNSSVELKRVPE
jgi:hypothetical protein